MVRQNQSCEDELVSLNDAWIQCVHVLNIFSLLA